MPRHPVLCLSLALASSLSLAASADAPAVTPAVRPAAPPATACKPVDGDKATAVCEPLDPQALLAAQPSAAGPRKALAPLTRQQVLAELVRARQRGDMDFARQEIGDFSRRD